MIEHPITPEDQRKIFFQKILSLTAHDIELRAFPSSRRFFTRDLNIIENFIEENKNDNLYFGVYTREGGGTKQHVKEIYCYFADIDFKEYPGGEVEAREKLDAFINSTGLKPTFIIHSGNGLHIYWFLNRVIEPFQKVEAILRGIAKHLGADINVCELARILRVPGTFNYKNNDRKPVSIIEQNDISYDPGVFDQFEYEDTKNVTSASNNGSKELSAHIDEIKSKCEFLRYCYENRKKLPEPLWFSMVTNLCKYSSRPIDIVHAFSQGYSKYSERETDQKIRHSLNDTGPHTCTYIKENMKNYVGSDCGKDCGVTSPVVLLNRKSDFNEDDEKPTQAVKLIRLASKYKLFHDDTKEAYAQIENESIKVRSNTFKQILAREMYQTEGKAPNSDALNQALNVIEAQARFDGECVRLFNRIAEREGNFYYDLCNGRAVKITNFGWSIVDAFPILFKRYAHQQMQNEPKHGGNINKLFNFLNVKNQKHRLLILVYLISCFVPDIPHPIFHPWGDQGSGKTTMFIFFKLLVDPSKLSVIITPRDHNELVQILDHHYLCLFDNLSSFPGWLSDLLSQACTGGGFSKRRLYTDDDDVIFQIMRCIGLNGINLLIGKPDLMDRTILLHLERIEPSNRKEWKILMEEFETERPFLLGCLFNVLARAKVIYPNVTLSHLPRMADFVRWGVAIAQALGYQAQEFIDAYQGNVESQNAEIINSNTLAQAILSFMDDKETWSGTVKEAYEKLSPLVTISKEDRTFPKHYNKLRHGLNRIKPNLLDSGIRFSIADFNTREGVFMSFQKVGKVSSQWSQWSQSNEIKDLHCEDNVKIKKVSSLVSSPDNSLENKVFEDREDREDKIPVLEGGKKYLYVNAEVD